MTDAIRFPSEQFPDWPAISLTLPRAWAGAQVPSTLMAARREVEPGQFMSNVIVRAQRVAGDVDLKAAAAMVDDGVGQLDEVEDVGRWLITTDGRKAYAREFAFRSPAVGTLAQAWRVFLIQHDGVTDLVELVGTVSPQRTSDLAEVRAIMDSIEFRIAIPAGQH